MDEVVTGDRPHCFESGRRESNLLSHVLQIGSQVLFQNDRRSYVSENLRRSIQAELRRNDLHQSRAGGIRTHDIRLLRHVLQLGSRSLSPNVSIAAEGEGVEPSRLVMQARPASNGSRRHSVCPSVMCFSSSTRNRTWNFSLEARDDVRFTIEPCSLRQSVEPTSGRQGS